MDLLLAALSLGSAILMKDQIQTLMNAIKAIADSLVDVTIEISKWIPLIVISLGAWVLSI